MEHHIIYITLAIIFAAFMAWGIGANDVANAMGTSVGSKAISLKQALIIAAIFEAAGCLLAGGEVTQTISKGIIDPTIFAHQPEVLVQGMLAALLGTGIWLLVASNRGWPVSTTHSIVGAIIGFAIFSAGPDAVHWSEILVIASSWIFSPILAGLIAFALFMSMQALIFNAHDPLKNARRYSPIYIFILVFIIAMVTFTKGLKHVNLHLTGFDSVMYSILLAVIITSLGAFLLQRMKFKPKKNVRSRFYQVEKIFSVLVIFSACAMAFAHGSNDVANAIGPLAAIVSMVESGGQIALKSGLSFWILLLGAAFIVIGLASYGYKVIATIGREITELTPSRGFAASVAAASTIVISSGTGLPVSTTQVLVGAVLGVGMARGIAALNLTVIRNTFMSWVITIPAGALLAALFYYYIKVFI